MVLTRVDRRSCSDDQFRFRVPLASSRQGPSRAPTSSYLQVPSLVGYSRDKALARDKALVRQLQQGAARTRLESTIVIIDNRRSLETRLAQQRQGPARDSCESGFENVIDITSQDIVFPFSLFGPFAMRNIVRGVCLASIIMGSSKWFKLAHTV